MKSFLRAWKYNFKSSCILSLLVIIMINAGSIFLEDGMRELMFVAFKHGVILTMLLLLFSIALNSLILALLVSFVYTVIETLREIKLTRKKK